MLVVQFKKWKKLSLILVITKDYISFCHTVANPGVDWAVGKAPLNVILFDSLAVSLIFKTKNA